jgi:hypothetical protein
VVTTLDTHPSVSLLVPCRAEYASLCRLVVGALALREALDQEAVADLKMIVTEAFNCFLSPTGCASASQVSEIEPAATLQLNFFVLPQEWTIVVSSPDRSRGIPESVPPNLRVDSALALVILEALVDSVERIDSDAEGSGLRLVKRFAPSVDGED